MKTLYLCYFGLREPLVQTQVLPYLRELVKGGVEVNLLTFEPNWRNGWSREERGEWRARLLDEGIHWRALAYHKRPSLPATLYDTLAGAGLAAWLVWRHKIDALHARAHIPLLMGAMAKLVTGCKLVFDIRGLMANEYADAGVWAEQSAVFRAIKFVEKLGIKHADQLVVLTHRLRDLLVERQQIPASKIEVIPCCTEQPRTSAPNRAEDDSYEVIYAGSVTGLYLLEEMAQFFLTLQQRQPHAVLRILTGANRAEVAARLQSAGLNEESFLVMSARPAEVPSYLRRARLGLSFRKSTFSQIAASPTKIPEYLAAGIPVVCNAGVGDMDQLIEQNNVGAVITNLSHAGYARAIWQLELLARDPDLARRCRATARRHFDLEEIGGAGYRRVYAKLLDNAPAA